MYLLLSFFFLLCSLTCESGFLTVLPFHICITVFIYLMSFLLSSFFGWVRYFTAYFIAAALSIWGSVLFVTSFMSVAYVSCLALVSFKSLSFWVWFSNCLIMCLQFLVISHLAFIMQILCACSLWFWSPFSTIVPWVHSTPYSLWTTTVDPIVVEMISEIIIVLVSFWLYFNQCFVWVILTVCIYWWSIEY